MSWSYDPTNLVTTTSAGRLNVVRFLVGDTDTTDQQVQDEEITFLNLQSTNVYYTAANTAETIAAKYSRLVDVELDRMTQDKNSVLSQQYYALANRLRALGQRMGGFGVAAGGLSRADMEAVRSNTDRNAPSFRRDQFQNPPDGTTDPFYNYPW